jgi:DDE family transposase
MSPATVNDRWSGRSLHIGEHDELLAAARAQANTPEFAAVYPRRSLVERSSAWVVNHGHRRCRYRGVKRNQLWLSLRVAAVNLTTLLGLGLHYDDGWRVARNHLNQVAPHTGGFTLCPEQLLSVSFRPSHRPYRWSRPAGHAHPGLPQTHPQHATVPTTHQQAITSAASQ